MGDGLSNRYALICKHCHGHNGMSLKEEFEYAGEWPQGVKEKKRLRSGDSCLFSLLLCVLLW